MESSREIRYMKMKYPFSYAIAVDITRGKRPQNHLYFDERYWRTSDIQEFFEDLQVCDNVVWEAIVSKIGNQKPKYEKVFARIREWIPTD